MNAVVRLTTALISFTRLISAKPLNPLPGNLLVKYIVFVAKATSFFFVYAHKRAFYYNGGKGRFRWRTAWWREKKVPRPLPCSLSTEKEQQDRGNYLLQVLNLCKLIIYANCQKSLGSAVPIAVLRNKWWTSNGATTSPLPVRVGLVSVQFQISIRSFP